MGLKTYNFAEFTTSGGTLEVDPKYVDVLVLKPATSPITMAGNTEINFIGTPDEGETITIIWNGSIVTGAFGFSINSLSLGGVPMSKKGALVFTYVGGAWISAYVPDLNQTGLLNGNVLRDGSVDLAAIKSGASANIIVANAGGVPVYVVLSGDATISNAGALTIANNAITNAKIAAAAAIARTKLASGTPNFILVNDGAGVMGESQFVPKANGGFGASVAAATGFSKWNAGTSDISATSFTIPLLVSFEAVGGIVPSVGDFKIKMSGSGTVTEIYAEAVSAIGATNSGTITAKNGAGTGMTSGVVTFLASDPRGTAYTVTPSANNSFVDGDILTFTTAKGTAGGMVQLSIKISRTS